MSISNQKFKRLLRSIQVHYGKLNAALLQENENSQSESLSAQNHISRNHNTTATIPLDYDTSLPIVQISLLQTSFPQQYRCCSLQHPHPDSVIQKNSGTRQNLAKHSHCLCRKTQMLLRTRLPCQSSMQDNLPLGNETDSWARAVYIFVDYLNKTSDSIKNP